MTSSMIDRVAAAICGEASWGPASDSQKDKFRLDARHAIAAMREPTAQMLAAGRPEIVKINEEGYRQSASVIAECTFVAMIDAAIGDDL